MIDHTSARSKWARLMEWLGADSSQVLSTYDKVIVPRYEEPHRHYHTLAHIVACLDVLGQLAPLGLDVEAIELALWFHDIIYDPFSKDNEEASAKLLLGVAPSLGIPNSTTEEAVRLILLTRHSAAPEVGDLTGAYMIDADLSILGESSDFFDSYEAAIRAEYAQVPDAIFWPRRKEVLLSFLSRDRLYLSEEFHRQYEASARANLRRAVDRIA